MQPFSTIFNHFSTIFNNFQPFSTIFNHFQPFSTIFNFKKYQYFLANLNNLNDSNKKNLYMVNEDERPILNDSQQETFHICEPTHTHKHTHTHRGICKLLQQWEHTLRQFVHSLSRLILVE